jgi:polysaccharide export outer membrane protein
MIFTFARSRETPLDGYILSVGDELQITSTSDEALKIGDLLQGRGAAIQPDGTLWVNQIGKVTAAGLTIEQLRKNLEIAFKEFLNEPAIDILPVKTNSRVEDILEAIDARQGLTGGRTQTVTVLEDGTVRLLKVGAVCVQGLTLDDVKRELNLRYQQFAPGIYVEPNIQTFAPHFIFVYGQVTKPDRYQLNGPTTVTQALAQAGGVNVRGNAREVVIFRRAEDWRYISTRLDLQGLHLGKVPTPADEIEVGDSDLIIVPLTPIARFNDFVDQVFVRGVYGIFPVQFQRGQLQ